MWVLPDCKKIPDRHHRKIRCVEGQDRMKNLPAIREERMRKNVEMLVNGKRLKNFQKFKYLGRWLNNRNEDEGAVILNIEKARGRWGKIRGY